MLYTALKIRTLEIDIGSVDRSVTYMSICLCRHLHPLSLFTCDDIDTLAPVLHAVAETRTSYIYIYDSSFPGK